MFDLLSVLDPGIRASRTWPSELGPSRRSQAVSADACKFSVVNVRVLTLALQLPQMRVNKPP